MPTKALERLVCKMKHIALGLDDNLDYDNEGGGKEEVEDFDDNDDNEDNICLVTNILSNVVENFATWSYSITSENEFIDQHLPPFLKRIFRHVSIAMRRGETHICNKPNELMAGYVGYHEVANGSTYDLLTVVVKLPSESSQSQLQSDFIKVGKEMKTMLDELTNLGVEKPNVAGILVEGHELSTFSMRLVHDDVYIMRQHDHLRLLQTPESIVLVPSIIEYMMQLATLLQDTVNEIDKRVLSNERATSPHYWQQTSAGIPQRTSIPRYK
ncbi:hypothetical protein BDA99DRAFT_531364 [Phascolomyces articulosus]|uniref:Uncharacterized protein n=1 Tax=Phascolomyces articulosus TaxID=60185 RepID=A0AAD5KQM5_9FUNG|nr:hypothetical protein BDA99DRAFT_531364 [Phascolomyces articulosus]